MYIYIYIYKCIYIYINVYIYTYIPTIVCMYYCLYKYTLSYLPIVIVVPPADSKHRLIKPLTSTSGLPSYVTIDKGCSTIHTTPTYNTVTSDR